jgi:3-oxoacyl-[acyl-carrier-protein] synthase II
MNRRVVVTGYGVVSPVGIGIDPFWSSLINGKSGIARTTQFDATNFDSQVAGEVNDFTPPDFFTPKDVLRVPRFIQFAQKAAQEAFDMSGLSTENCDPYRVGAIIGNGVGSMETIESEYKVFLDKGPRKLSPFLIPRIITNEAVGHVAIRHKLKGPNFCTVTACASGAHAIGESYWAIRSGRMDAAACGGTEAAIVATAVGGFCAIKALCKKYNDAPEKACRPFDKDRCGFIMAEGAGVVILEEYEFAKKRGANILAELAGYGATCDAYHVTAPDPEGGAAAYGINQCLDMAGVSKDEFMYINAHGTSTQLNDKMETAAIKRALGEENARKINISSTKSMTGHTIGAAGAIEFIASCLAVQNNIIPPTINYETPDPDCDLNYTPNTAVERDVDVALSNSLGFGGHNATLLIKKFK